MAERQQTQAATPQAQAPEPQRARGAEQVQAAAVARAVVAVLAAAEGTPATLVVTPQRARPEQPFA